MIRNNLVIFSFAISLVASTGFCQSVRFSITGDDESPLPCRIHLSDEQGNSVKATNVPSWDDHFVCDGHVNMDVPEGKYSWVIERGPEYRPASGTFQCSADETTSVAVQLKRIASMRDEGWYCADLHVHRPVADIALLMLAEDLDYAPVLQWWNQPATASKAEPTLDFRFDGHRLYTILAGEDERQGGALLYFGLNRPLDLTVRSKEYPSPMHFVDEAYEINQKVWIDIEKPFWWDVPAWIASGRMKSIGLANNHMNRSGMLASEAWGKARDSSRLPDPIGNGFWTQEIYYHLLECGIRIPPSAGSASGVLKNPVGYNRVYVHLGGKEFSRESWFDGLAAGRCFVTNGPLLRVKADGDLPGKVFKLPDSGQKEIKIEIELTSNDPLFGVELIANGRVIKRLACDDSTTQHLETSMVLDGPGWFLVRTIADNDTTFRFASTAPWYVESADGGRRISRPSARFFVNWVRERIAQIERSVKNPSERRAVLDAHEKALEFWSTRVKSANADLDLTNSPIEATSVVD